MAEAPTIYKGLDGRQVRVYVCDVCRQPFEWSRDGSQWYGSIADVEDGEWEAITVLCSLGCKWRFMDMQREVGID